MQGYYEVMKSIGVFLLACFFEVGGGYLVWLWLKEHRGLSYGIIGLVMLGIYGVVATLQPANFGRVYASYGGFFIIFSLFWAMIFDNFKPDKFDIIGSLIALFGVCVIMYAKR